MNSANTKEAIDIQLIDTPDKKLIEQITEIHLETFKGFFLTFMGKGFLRHMYSAYCAHPESGLYVAFDAEKQPIGFLAFSCNMSGLYKFMIKTRILPFAWYSLGAFLRKPSVFAKLVRALWMPSTAKREASYIRLSSIGVSPAAKGTGVGSQLMQRLISDTDFEKYAYITLETDAENNESANNFYMKNGFVLHTVFETHEGRKMNEYRRTGK